MSVKRESTVYPRNWGKVQTYHINKNILRKRKRYLITSSQKLSKLSGHLELKLLR